MSIPRVSVIVAALNEEASIEACVRRILAVFPGDSEILVIAGGTDRTADIVDSMSASAPQVRCIRNPHDRGKGHAIRVGVQHARAPVHAQIDADLQFLPEDLPRLVEPLVLGVADVALGTRFAAGSRRLPGGTPWVRTLGNAAVSGFASVLFGRRLTDVMAGMKAWTAAAMRTIAFESDNYSYEVEIPVRALANSLRVVEVPITTGPRKSGSTNVRVFRAGVVLFRDLVRFRAERFRPGRPARP